MRRTKTTNILHGIAMSGFLLVLSLLFQTHATHAASITIATGTDEETVNSNCSLSEAITNINNGDSTSYPECTNTSADPYGTNDTITIPEGVVTLNAPSVNIDNSVVVRGAGMGKTIIDGTAQYTPLNAYASTPSDVSISLLTVRHFKGTAISTGGQLNLSLSYVEVDGNGSISDTGNSSGISFVSTDGNNKFHLDHGYVHDLAMTDAQAMGVITVTGDNTTLTSEITDTTIENIATTTGQSIGILQGFGFASPGPPAPTAATNTITNVTITGVHSESSSAAGYVVSGYVVGGTTTVESYLRNVTIADINGVLNSQAGLRSSALAIATGANGTDDHFNTSIHTKNVLIAESQSEGSPSSCTTFDISGGFGGTGSSNGVITSSGGNITDDTTCNSYFTQPTDKNNITTLKDFLGPISNNGGYVPTIPLLAGSPAIDNGITVSDLTTDARGVTRPQGQAYDSGAYEYVPTANLAGTGENVTAVLVTAAMLVTFAVTVRLLFVDMLQ